LKTISLYIFSLLLLALLLSGCGKSKLDEEADGAKSQVIVENAIAVRELPPAVGGLSGTFNQYVNVFGVHIVATDDVPRDRLLHAANVMAQYLDNNGNSLPDNHMVVAQMIAHDALIIMPATQSGARLLYLKLPFHILRAGVGQELYGEETVPPGQIGIFGGFDASLEEILHLITNAGYAQAYPETFDSMYESELLRLSDQARGGRFDSPPEIYPAEAWFHYDDETCDRACNADEYFYWALTTLLGGQMHRCEEIAREWEPCTAEQLREVDPEIVALLTDSQWQLPTELPNGRYQGVLPEPQNLGDTSGRLARDGISLLDLIIGGAVALILGTVLAVRWYRRRLGSAVAA
jgi:hypothetical protein